MLRSTFCSLFECSDKELTELGECPYDQVGCAWMPWPRGGAVLVGMRACRLTFESTGQQQVNVLASPRAAAGTGNTARKSLPECPPIFSLYTHGVAYMWAATAMSTLDAF